MLATSDARGNGPQTTVAREPSSSTPRKIYEVATARYQPASPKKPSHYQPGHRRTRSVAHVQETEEELSAEDVTMPQMSPSAHSAFVARKPSLYLLPQSRFNPNAANTSTASTASTTTTTAPAASSRTRTPERPRTTESKAWTKVAESMAKRSRTPSPEPRASQNYTTSPKVEDDGHEVVKQLIRQTDDAFRDVGKALAEGGVMARGFSKRETSGKPPRRPSARERSKTMMNPASKSLPLTPPPRPARTFSTRDTRAPPRIRFEFPARKPTPSVPPKSQARLTIRQSCHQPCQPGQAMPSRSSSVTKAKRTSAAAKQQQQRRHSSPRRIRWGAQRKTLAENVAELLSPFKRIEADEPLSAEKIQEFTAKREQKEREEMMSADAEAGTQLEEMQSTEDEMADSKVETPEIAAEARTSEPKSTTMPTTPEMVQLSPIDTSFIERVAADVASPASDSMTITVFAYPGATATTPEPFEPQSRPLPLIPELKVTPPDASDCLPKPVVKRKPVPTPPSTPPTLPTTPTAPAIPERRRPQLSREPATTSEPYEMKERGVFKSTPFTLTAPRFRHGAIQLSEPENEPKHLAAEETLDWTAFQMAILGGAGEWDDEPVDESELADDLTTWFSGFGFDRPGGLVSEDDIRRGRSRYRNHSLSSSYSSTTATTSTTLTTRSNSAGSPASSPGSLPAEKDLPISVAGEYPSGFWDQDDAAVAERFYSSAGAGIKRWTAEQQPKRRRDRSASFESLPQSPMMPLVAVRAGPGDEVEYVAMGYNLGHDLGDFLRWEAENVYASAL